MLKLKFITRTVFVLLVCISSLSAQAFEFEPWSEELYGYVGEQYGFRAQKHARDLNALLDREAHDSEAAKLAAVNDFFNRVHYVTDQEHWGQSDYWQTPLQTLFEFKGDCEDIAIAKYTALRVLGFDEQRLNMVYVKSELGPHMVMSYQMQGSEDPLVLDILTPKIVPASFRTDLVPVYEFNSTHLWLADKRSFAHGTELSTTLAVEKHLLDRIEKNLLTMQSHNQGKPLFPFALHSL